MTTVQTSKVLAEQWRARAGEQATSVAHNPVTGEPLAVYRNADAAEVDAVVARASKAFETWGSTTPGERAALLFKLADRLEGAAEEFARAESLNTGKPMAYAREEMAGNADVLRFMAGAARVPHGGTSGEFVAGSTSMLRRDPLGVAGLITPWNYPLMSAIWKVAPALAAGNTVVIKPSELTPDSTIMLVELAQEVLPEGVINLLLGDGLTGAALVAHPDIRIVSLTGDGNTGKKVAANAAGTLARVHLELGGKSPVLVFADAPIDEVAAELAAGAYVNSGQNCTAPCRLIVESEVYEKFVDAYCAAVENLHVGEPDDPRSHVGPLISEKQLERVAGFVERARAAGATVKVGGHRLERPGFFYAPTVVTDVSQDSEIVQNEVFGPVVTIQSANSEQEMLAMANDVPYGLAAGIWTGNLDRILHLTKSLTFGTVWVNQHDILANEMPFGGFGQSGYGKELSAHAIDEYSQVKHVVMKASR